MFDAAQHDINAGSEGLYKKAPGILLLAAGLLLMVSQHTDVDAQLMYNRWMFAPKKWT